MGLLRSNSRPSHFTWIPPVSCSCQVRFSLRERLLPGRLGAVGLRLTVRGWYGLVSMAVSSDLTKRYSLSAWSKYKSIGLGVFIISKDDPKLFAAELGRPPMKPSLLDPGLEYSPS